MKTTKYIVTIPEPCHEDWNKMQPDDKGKFCGSCSKSVFDFSNKTDAEIKDILLANKGVSMCGHFKKTQVNRPLNISINFNSLPKNISTTKAFAIALFLSFGSLLFSCTALDGKKIDTIEFVNNSNSEVLPPDTIKPDLLQNPPFLEETVDGGIRFQEVIVEDTVKEMILPPDSIKIEEMVMGIMIIDPLPLDTTAIEPVPNNEKLIKEEEEIIAGKENEFVVYPNPSSGELIIKYDVLKRADVRVDIFNVAGALVKTPVNINAQFEGKYQVPVNLSELPNGVYVVSLLNNGKQLSQKVVIEK